MGPGGGDPRDRDPDPQGEGFDPADTWPWIDAEPASPPEQRTWEDDSWLVVEPVAAVPAPEPRRGSDGVRVALSLALVLVLLATAALGAAWQRSLDQVEALRERVAEQREEIDRLRGGGTVGSTALDRVAATTERLRELTFKEKVEPEVLDDPSFADRLRKVLAEDLDREEFDASVKVLVALGIVDPDLDMWSLVQRLHEEQVAGFYDPKDGSLVVRGNDIDDPSPLTQTVIAHEYTHALTDQRFGLRDVEELQDANEDDRALALTSLAEGDASLLQELYMIEALTDQERGELLREAQAVPMEAFQQLPQYVQDSFTFPYDEGLAFVKALHAAGGWKAVDAAYADPPVSTEQIMHPERYMRTRDAPTRVRLPNVGRALGGSWRTIDQGTIGEFDVRGIADSFLPLTDSVAAGDGWDGGSYVALEARQGVVVAMETAWDSAAEAREAQVALGRWLPLRYGNDGSTMSVGDRVGRGWRAPAGAGAVVLDGARVVLVVGPTADSVQDVLRAFD